MSDKHQSHNELKKPDVFQVQGIKLLSWIDSNTKLLMMIIAPVVLLIGAFFVWNHFSQSQAERLRDELSKIDALYQKEEEGVSKQREAIQNEMQELIKTVKGNSKDLEPKFKELQEKMSLIKADHSQSQQKYAEFSSAHMDKAVGWRAGLEAASILVEKKEYVKATELLKTVISRAHLPVYQIQGRLFYASLLEETGKSEDALTEIDKALALKPSDDIAASALVTKGRILQEFGKKEEAVKAFDEVLSKYAETAEAEKARVAKTFVR